MILLLFLAFNKTFGYWCWFTKRLIGNWPRGSPTSASLLNTIFIRALMMRVLHMKWVVTVMLPHLLVTWRLSVAVSSLADFGLRYLQLVKLHLFRSQIMKSCAALLHSQLCCIQAFLKRLCTRLKILHLWNEVLEQQEQRPAGKLGN